MISKTFNYVDYNGTPRIDTCYFNLNKLELMELDRRYKDGVVKTLENILENKDTGALMDFMKEFILASYGEKSEDGIHFRKTDEIRNDFAQTEMYSELFMELMSNEEAAASFINGVIPKVSSAK